MTANSIVSRIGLLLVDKQLTVSVCESCTGGLLGAAITSVAGSSRYFVGGIIAYSDRIKRTVVGVKGRTLERYGAVSAQTAREMAQGVKRKMKSDIGVSITGIAGPTGGTKKKPVGSIYIAVAVRNKVTVRRFLLRGGRQNIRKSTVKKALEMTRDMLRVL